MKIGSLIPGWGVARGGDQLSGCVFGVIPLALSKELETVVVVAVVNAGFIGPVSGFAFPSELALPQSHLFELLRKIGRVEVLCAKGRSKVSKAHVERAPLGLGLA
jgi:hypothetical protein